LIKFISLVVVTFTSAQAEGFLQNLADQYFEQGDFKKKEIAQPKKPLEPKVDQVKITQPKSSHSSSSSSTTSFQNFADRLFSQGKYKKDEHSEPKQPRDKNTTALQDYVDRLLKQNRYKEN